MSQLSSALNLVAEVSLANYLDALRLFASLLLHIAGFSLTGIGLVDKALERSFLTLNAKRPKPLFEFVLIIKFLAATG
jgi:hypothetical protein